MQAHEAVKERARRALAGALCETRGTTVFDPEQDGYVFRLADNLVNGVTVEQIRPFFDKAAGHELDGKMRAAYSSSALAANSFTPWLADPGRLALAGESGFRSLEFEAVCPTGLAGTAPHLDLLAKGADAVVGVESKCIEYLDAHRDQGFAESYEPVLAPHRALRAVAADLDGYLHLNAAQLVKHMLGLFHTYPEKPATLLYLFWEPVNWREWQVFADHRAEVRLFARTVAGGPVAFRAMTYRQLWDEWSLAAGPAWVEAHAECLRDRYEVRILSRSAEI
ncbi:MAG TPA: hypothetical protein VD969_22420 [Symbiobacteriaceae bacterium]|nr:hypothetical protein [Symbiobacteriaceae bacterium]